MRLTKCLFFASLFILIFSLIVRFGADLAETSQVPDTMISDAYRVVEEMRFQSNPDFQLQNWFSKFRDELRDYPDSFFVRQMEPLYLEENLPPHSLTVAETNKKGKIVRYVNFSEEMDKDLTNAFIELALLYKVKFSDESMRKTNESKIARCDELLSNFIGVPTAKISRIILRATRVSIFNSLDSITWFYWDQVNKNDGGMFFIFSKMDVSSLDKLHSYRSYLKNSPVKGIHCGFYNINENSFVASKSFKRNTQDLDLKILARECKKKISGKRWGQVDEIVKVRLNSNLALIGRYIGKESLVPVVLVDLPQEINHSLAKNSNLPILAFICILLVFVVDTAVFSRGPSMKVGLVLILAMIFAILMTFLMGRSVFKLIMKEAFEKERLKVERDLHQALIGIDSSFKTTQLNLQLTLKQILKDPKIVERIRSEESQVKNEEIQNSVVHEIVIKVFEAFSKGYDHVPLKYRTLNAFILSGPNGFLRYFNKFRGDEIYTLESCGSSLESMIMMMSLFRARVFQTYPRDFLDDDFYAQLVQESKSKLEQLKTGEMKTELKASMGIDRFHEVMNSMSIVNTLRTSFGEITVAAFPLFLRNKVRYIAVCSWDEFAVVPVFLRRAFKLRVNADKALISSKRDSIFKALDPASYVERKPVAFMGYDGFRFDTFSTSEKDSEILGNLLKSTFRSKQLVKLETSGKKASIYEVLPGKSVTVYLTGAQQDITYLSKIENLRSIMFLIGMIVFLLFAIFAAKNISSSFTNPLEHLLWGLNRVQQNDYTVKLKDTREDEFGSISRAFNLMTRRLIEKEALGTFVSDSVRKLAANPELLKQACEGSEEDVTILFSNLEGFFDLTKDSSASEAQRYLELSLSRYFARADEFGGEVDKVIGEKILIVFSHNKLGKSAAIRAAVSMATSVLKDLAGEAVLNPVFGINTGRVISGIIGTPSVRMDLTVIGDPVNVAARLCALANSKHMPVIISGQIKDVLGETISTEKIDVEKVRGKSQEVEVFKLLV